LFFLFFRTVRRSGVASEAVRVGDVTDARFAAEAMRGASVAIACVVPPYHQWIELLEPLNRGILEGAREAKVPLLVLDNLYGYGRPTGPMRETSPVAPVSAKGELRARVAQKLLEAHRAGDVRVSIARASDFYGPGVTQAALFGERFGQRVLAGKSAESFGPAQLPHSFSYAPDIARDLVTLATSEKSWGEVWHTTVEPNMSTQSVVDAFSRALARPIAISQVPALVLRVMGLFMPPVKEMIEMLYQFQVPFTLDDSKFRAAFAQASTPVDEAAQATVRALQISSGRAA